jgi:hypothetical protein
MPNKPLHTEPRAARYSEINIVRRGPVNGDVLSFELCDKNAACHYDGITLKCGNSVIGSVPARNECTNTGSIKIHPSHRLAC